MAKSALSKYMRKEPDAPSALAPYFMQTGEDLSFAFDPSKLPGAPSAQVAPEAPTQMEVVSPQEEVAAGVAPSQEAEAEYIKQQAIQEPEESQGIDAQQFANIADPISKGLRELGGAISSGGASVASMGAEGGNSRSAASRSIAELLESGRSERFGERVTQEKAKRAGDYLDRTTRLFEAKMRDFSTASTAIVNAARSGDYQQIQAILSSLAKTIGSESGALSEGDQMRSYGSTLSEQINQLVKVIGARDFNPANLNEVRRITEQANNSIIAARDLYKNILNKKIEAGQKRKTEFGDYFETQGLDASKDLAELIDLSLKGIDVEAVVSAARENQLSAIHKRKPVTQGTNKKGSNNNNKEGRF